MHNIPRDEVFVIGHKNPDTDSICSAIAYADLKNQSENKYIPGVDQKRGHPIE